VVIDEAISDVLCVLVRIKNILSTFPLVPVVDS